MRYLLDTNIYIYWTTVRELIVAYNAKGWGNKRWKTAEDMVYSIEHDYFFEILPIQKEVTRRAFGCGNDKKA